MTLEQLIKDGYITCVKHPTEELYIYNYTNKCQYGQHWNEITISHRGLIKNKEGEVLYHCLPKIFNIEQMNNIPTLPYKVYDKLDGSLGIMYWVNNKPYIATRSSFDNNIANIATKILNNQYEAIISSLNPKYTYLFEIITPSNKVVVDYDNISDIYLLAILDENGKDLPLQNIGFPIVSEFNTNLAMQELQALNINNKEGFVFHFSNGDRIKVKFETYKLLHKLKHIVSYDTLINAYIEDKIETLIDVPDELYEELKQKLSVLKKEYDEIEKECKLLCSSFSTLQEALAGFKKHKYQKILFTMYRNYDYSKYIWLQIKKQHKNKCLQK